LRARPTSDFSVIRIDDGALIRSMYVTSVISVLVEELPLRHIEDVGVLAFIVSLPSCRSNLNFLF